MLLQLRRAFFVIANAFGLIQHGSALLDMRNGN